MYRIITLCMLLCVITMSSANAQLRWSGISIDNHDYHFYMHNNHQLNQLLEETICHRLLLPYRFMAHHYALSSSPKALYIVQQTDPYFFWLQHPSLYQHYGTQKTLFALGNIFKIETGPEMTKPLGSRLELTSSYKKVRLHKRGLSYTLSFKY